MTITLHSHDWVEVGAWGLLQVAEHWAHHHGDCPTSGLPQYESGTGVPRTVHLLARRYHQVAHLRRDDGTAPTGELLDKEALRLCKAGLLQVNRP